MFALSGRLIQSERKKERKGLCRNKCASVFREHIAPLFIFNDSDHKSGLDTLIGEEEYCS